MANREQGLGPFGDAGAAAQGAADGNPFFLGTPRTNSSSTTFHDAQKAYEILCVSQFTLYGRLNGNKPDYSKAMPPSLAGEAYAAFVQRLGRAYAPERVKDGVFGAMMEVELVNDGPVTLVLDSDRSAAADDAAAELPLDAL